VRSSFSAGTQHNQDLKARSFNLEPSTLTTKLARYSSIGAFTCSGFSAKLRKSATEKRDPKKHLSLSVAICDRKHAN